MKSLIHMIASFAVCAACAGSVSAQSSQSRPAPEVIKLTLHAAPADAKSLEFKLLPDLIDQTQGDAVPLYMISSEMGGGRNAMEEFMKQATDQNYLEMPLDQLVKTDLQKWLDGRFSNRLKYAAMAAHRERANFDASIREEGVGSLLPYLNDMRGTADLLVLQGRLQIARRDWRGAERTFQTGFSMAHQLNDHPVVIQGLVETGIATMFVHHLNEWGTQPDAPNLYWALSHLPQPFVDLTLIRQWEQAILYFTFPELGHGDPTKLSVGQWRSIGERLIRLNRQASREAATRPIDEAQFIKDKAPQARQFLLKEGMTAATIDAMAPEQLVGLYLFRQYQVASNEAWKAWELPYWQTESILPGGEALFPQKPDINNPFMILIPSLRRARAHFARLDQEICVSRLIEALRDYAARHDGRAPASLDDMKDLPIPIDPFTNQRFPYRVEGATAIIEPPALTFVPQIFRITFSK